MNTPSEKQHCLSYCLSDNILLENLTNELGDRYTVIRFKDVCHVHAASESSHIYIFRYGVIVYWGGSEDFRVRFNKKIQPFLVSPVKDAATDDFTFSKATEVNVTNDLLSFDQDNGNIRLAFSHALGQSAKLSSFEDMAHETVENTKPIPERLAKTGKTLMNAKGLAKMRGQLYLVSSRINLQHELLDTPEYYWENPTYEPQYTLMARYLEIAPRIEVLNRKLKVIHDLFDMLADEQKHKHSAFLEWVIIILIAVEIVFFFLHDIFKVF